MDFAQNELISELFAVRFKLEETARLFYNKFVECQSALKVALPKTSTAATIVPAAAQSVPAPEEVEQEDQEDVEDEEDGEEEEEYVDVRAILAMSLDGSSLRIKEKLHEPVSTHKKEKVKGPLGEGKMMKVIGLQHANGSFKLGVALSKILDSSLADIIEGEGLFYLFLPLQLLTYFFLN